MAVSLNCLILGQASEDIFNVIIDDKYSFSELTVSYLKELLFRTKKIKNVVQDSDNMKLWKVELNLKDLNKIYTKDDIENLGTWMKPMDGLDQYFDQNDKQPKKKFLHIIIQPLPATTG